MIRLLSERILSGPGEDAKFLLIVQAVDELIKAVNGMDTMPEPNLDAWGALVAVARHDDESDEDYRQRIIKAMRPQQQR